MPTVNRAMSLTKVVLVTGANKGIGYGIICGLAKTAGSSPGRLALILASRDEARGQKAAEEARKKAGANANVDIVVAQLDVCSKESIKRAVDEIKAKFGGIDILVNNAGWAAKGDAFDSQVVQDTFAPNYYGLVAVTEMVLPVLRPNGRIIHVSSGVGQLSILKSEELRARFSSPKLDKEGLDALVKEFEDSVADRTYSSKGWPRSAYGVSKAAVTAHAGILSRMQEVKEKNVMVFAVDPGWCRTDMAGDHAPKSADQGAETPVHLCVAPDSEVVHGNGKYWYEGAVVEW